MSEPRLAIVTANGESKDRRAAAVAATLREIEPGAAIVLLRDKGLDATTLLDHLRTLEAVCRAHDAPLYAPWDVRGAISGALSKSRIGDDIGWHFPDRPHTLPLIEKVRAAEPERRISASTHAASAAVAIARYANIVYLGPIWPTPEKPDAIGLEELGSAARQIEDARLFAIGGITGPTRAKQALGAGADGIAGIRSFTVEHIAGIAGAV